MTRPTRPPGSDNPHADQRNWRPAETLADYLRNCREGLEQYSDTRAAKIMGWPRVQVWRARMMAEVPEAIFEELMEAGVTSTKALAQVGQSMVTGSRGVEIERCPHCSGVLRSRSLVSRKAAAVIDKAAPSQKPNHGV